MRSFKMVAAVALLACSMVYANSQIVYTLELGGNNNADQYELGNSPTFTQGNSSGTYAVAKNGDDLTWAVRVSVGGTHVGAPGDNAVPYGAANLVFDLELYKDGVLFSSMAAAPLVASGAQKVPSSYGWWSSINDGDSAGGIRVDQEANAAFAIGIHNQGPSYSGQNRRLIDPVSPTPSGPNFDYGWYPTANGRGGRDIGFTKPLVTSVSTVGGKLVGFGAGYKSYDYTSYRPGVGILYLTSNETDYGFGAFVDRIYAPDPLAVPVGVKEKVLFEGQISTKGMPAGTYTLKVVPSADGNNILHGAVAWNSTSPNYNGFGSFAAKANEVVVANPNGLQFTVPQEVIPTQLVGRKIFYNQSWYDGNKIGIDPAPIPTTTAPLNNPHEDDGDAIDPTKSPLMAGAGLATFANWTGYNKGINGLIYDVKNPTRAPVAADFTFVNKGKAGTSTIAVAHTGFLAIATSDPTVTRCIFTFANVYDCWLEVTVGTGFGLPAAAGQNYAEKHWWGNARGDTGQGNTSPNITVNPGDEVMCRPPYLHNSFNRAFVDDVSDLNKNSLVDPNDEVLCRPPYVTTSFNCVKMISR